MKSLSENQKAILRLTFEKRFLTSQEILAELWGWKNKEQRTPKYASGHSSLSRCLTRLWRRGLIEYWKTLTGQRTGITLTNKGKMLAVRTITEEQKR
jgi:hypothetical protein